MATRRRLVACASLLAVARLAMAAELSLRSNELYFRADGRPSFLQGRNPTGTKLEHFDELLTWAAESGERIVRIHLMTGFQPHAAAGVVDEAWARQWERVFDLAAARGLHVLPVFGVWSDWNDGSGGLANAPGAAIGIRHALWAALASGAMNGRMLWWEDGYDRYQQLGLRAKSAHAATPAAVFVRGLDFTGFRPVAVALPRELKGAALGDERSVIAWFRDARCEPPGWPIRAVAAQRAMLTAPGAASDWAAEFFETGSGRRAGEGKAARKDNAILVELPAFEGSVALKLTARH